MKIISNYTQQNQNKNQTSFGASFSSQPIQEQQNKLQILMLLQKK